jgi:serine/threonine-protein phosphatase CPPED1
MNRKYEFITIILLLLLCWHEGHSDSTEQTKKEAGQKTLFMIIADPQLGIYSDPYMPIWTSGRCQVDSTCTIDQENLRKAVSAANKLKPFCIVVCGDMVDNFNDTISLNLYKSIMSEVDSSIRVYHVPGNHDVFQEPTPLSLQIYRTRFGPDYYTINSQNLTGIVLNSSLIMDSTLALADYRNQEKWLDSTLTELDKTGNEILIFQHHPLFISSINDTVNDNGMFNYALRLKYLNLFASHNIHYIFAGHVHTVTDAIYNNIEMITNGTTSFSFSNYPLGVCLVELSSDGVKHQYYNIDSLPESYSITKTDSNNIPDGLLLLQSYPNPFNPSTNLRFDLPHKSKVDVEIYNMIGQHVAQLLNNVFGEGYHEIRWNATHLSSGVYFAVMKVNDLVVEGQSFKLTKKLLLIK